MSSKKSKPLLNRKETQSLLKTLKLTSTAGVLSLTLAGWGMLAQVEARTAQVDTSQPVAMVAAPAESDQPAPITKLASAPPPQPSPTPAPRKVRTLDVVQWVQDVQGNPVAVVRDNRGSLWFVLGSDVTRLEQGLSPQVQPQLVQMTTRTRAS
ncbi:MAG: hypothetical protein FOGNACKC_00134 [Anaerolineae bacterium]|nr:hypothetical protein [Anaerolineae bacterium]